LEEHVRLAIWTAVVILGVAFFASFIGFMLTSDRRFVMLTISFQVACLAMASFLDRGVT
jgi:hypothetical protein